VTTTQQRFNDRMRAQLQDGREALVRKSPPPWRFPELGDFRHHQRVLAFDATLTNCGWTAFTVTPERVMIDGKGTIRPETAETGYLGTWDKARLLQWGIKGLTLTYLCESITPCDLVVEAPSVGGGSRTESSLVAGMLVWMESPVRCAVVSATHVSAVLLGDPRCRSAERKKRIRAAVIRLCPEAAGRGWNEHERDSLATGLVHLHDEKEGAGDER
jgi:hypothetical protein